MDPAVEDNLDTAKQTNETIAPDLRMKCSMLINAHTVDSESQDDRLRIFCWRERRYLARCTFDADEREDQRGPSETDC